jgi:serine/threonine protein kinase
MMYEMVTGEVPYDGMNAMEIMHKQVNAPIPKPQPRPGLKVPMRMLQLVEACMQKEPEDRPADGATVLAELQKVQEDIENSSAILTAHMPLPQRMPPSRTPSGCTRLETPASDPLGRRCRRLSAARCHHRPDHLANFLKP